MAGITLAQAEAKLTAWLAADETVATGQSYTINGRSLTRANAGEIRENIDYWDGKCKELANASPSGGMRIFGATPT